MEERRNNRYRGHSVILENREKLSISGVEHVNNFNSELIVVDTTAGVITIKGEELDVKKLSLEDGNVSISGTVHSMVYSDRESFTAKSSGFFSKMFK
ncbi:sporulation protein YabP [Natronincola ferrireducens]|uniref:Sporulation protein YabP n=1 Tax=Natronincola ferrireducens TaxID=393762 RepID=A0A1G8X057_9FIRM|nr:sporulation protein YabP [Natronincola ferrireducens]SDJ83706.1 sporulation protein YabP [Natronincola ferrireducens]